MSFCRVAVIGLGLLAGIPAAAVEIFDPAYLQSLDPGDRSNLDAAVDRLSNRAAQLEKPLAPVMLRAERVERPEPRAERRAAESLPAPDAGTPTVAPGTAVGKSAPNQSIEEAFSRTTGRSLTAWTADVEQLIDEIERLAAQVQGPGGSAPVHRLGRLADDLRRSVQALRTTAAPGDALDDLEAMQTSLATLVALDTRQAGRALPEQDAEPSPAAPEEESAEPDLAEPPVDRLN